MHPFSRNVRASLAVVFIFAWGLVVSSDAVAQPSPTPTWTNAKTAAQEFPAFQWLGEFVKDDQSIQVVPAEGRFYLSIYTGGFPGRGWDGGTIEHKWLDSDAMQKELTGFEKIDRAAKLTYSPPPKGAVVLFDGSGKEEWANAQIKDGLLQAGAKTRRKFKDFRLHFECLIPFKPSLPLSHPDRGNSGVFALGAYEIQIADTFGLDPAPKAWTKNRLIKKPSTWCGSIYGIRAPTVNACLPPLTWQTFDLHFTAARFEKERKVSPARMTVSQNGILIHDDVEVPSGTGGGPSGPRSEVASGPLLFQKHHNPTQFRNVWLIEKPDADEKQ